MVNAQSIDRARNNRAGRRDTQYIGQGRVYTVQSARAEVSPRPLDAQCTRWERAGQAQGRARRVLCRTTRATLSPTRSTGSAVSIGQPAHRAWGKLCWDL